MSKKRINKALHFWESWKETCIDKGAREQIKKLQRMYKIHRSKNQKIVV